jgi:hypothetical protein
MPRPRDPYDCGEEIEERVMAIFELIIIMLPAEQQDKARDLARTGSSNARAIWDSCRVAAIDVENRRVRQKLQKARDGQRSAEAALAALNASSASSSSSSRSRPRPNNSTIALG